MPSVTIIVASLALLVAAANYLYQSWLKSRALDHIPTHEFPDGNNFRARYVSELKDLLESGYRKYDKSGRPFKVAIPIGGYPIKYRVVLPKDHFERVEASVE